jgi:hypothetical protein
MLNISIFALEISNIIIMTRTKTTTSVLIIAAAISTVAFTFLESKMSIFGDMDHESLYYILLGLMVVTFLSYKIRIKRRLFKRADDELSIFRKYKASYYAYKTTIFIWLMVFILQKYFLTAQAMLGVGMFLSVIFGIVAKIVANREINEE